MKPNSPHRAGPNSTDAAWLAGAYLPASGVANACPLQMSGKDAAEQVQVGADHASNALHVHAADALVSDAGALDVGLGDGHQAPNEGGAMACHGVSKLQIKPQIKPQVRADLIIPDLPPFVERASTATSSVAPAPGRSDEAHLSVSQWPL